MSWLREKRKRATWKVWIAPALTLIVISIASTNLILTITANRPDLVFINAMLSPPPEMLTISWTNMGKRSALRGTATLFTVSDDGYRHEKFGQREITTGNSTTLTPTGHGYAQIDVDMHKFLGLLLVCIKYHDETNSAYKQKFLLQLLSDNNVYRIDALPSKHHVCPRT